MAQADHHSVSRVRKEIEAAEDRLRRAQFANDVEALDELLSDQLQFVFLDGTVASKADDLTAHRNKLVHFHSISVIEQAIEVVDERLATVTALTEISATTGGETFRKQFRYGRTWAAHGDRWQIVSGNVTEFVRS